MAKIALPVTVALYPAPVVLVSCIDKKTNKPNIITIAWCGVASSNPPLLNVSIRPSRYSHKLIRETGDFVINIPSKGLVYKVDRCGIVSGEKADKFQAFGLTPAPSSKVSSPLILECPVNIECVTKKILPLGTHDMFLGEVVAVHADESIITKKNSVDYEKAGAFVYNQGEYWDLGRIIGTYGYSGK